MPISSALSNLKLPAIAAPMLLISNPDLVVEVCRSGLIGTFPALNQRSTAGFEAWMVEINQRLAAFERPAPWGVNLVVHKTNTRLEADLDAILRHRPPLVITSLGAVRDIVEAVHSYGGLVFHDVISRRHAEKAAAAGVDGIIAVCAGAGGHAGTLSPFAFVAEIRSIFAGTIVVSGAISHGRDIAAVRAMSGDLAYIGTRFIATHEAAASEPYRQMLVDANTADIVYTPAISGVNANFLRPSIAATGMDPDNLTHRGELDMNNAQAWKTVWSAGHGVAAIHDILSAAELCARLKTQYIEAIQALATDPYVAL
ncbi:NAD(P)H-dependent flavin oxidoreductase [Devosia sp. A369]